MQINAWATLASGYRCEIQPVAESVPGLDSGLDLIREGLADRLGIMLAPNGECVTSCHTCRPILAAVVDGGVDGDELVAYYAPEQRGRPKGWYCGPAASDRMYPDVY
jgi:hypothetical protein